jgi:hypothetical protein
MNPLSFHSFIRKSLFAFSILTVHCLFNRQEDGIDNALESKGHQKVSRKITAGIGLNGITTQTMEDTIPTTGIYCVFV